MTYSFAPHVETLMLSPGIGEAPSALRSFALIDAAQLELASRPARPLLPGARSAHLFEETFAKAALHLSPVLIELDAVPSVFVEQIGALDRACQHLPVMALLRSTASLTELTAHLRSVLLVSAEHVPYLLRFADTEMLAATNEVFTPAQRAHFFERTEAWLTVNFDGVLDDAASPAMHAQVQPASPAPLVFDAAQTDGLMKAAAAPILASQLRHLHIDFAERLDHAEQVRFASRCITASALEDVDPDADLLVSATVRWQSSTAEMEKAS